jgi:hypothetical protein
METKHLLPYLQDSFIYLCPELDELVCYLLTCKVTTLFCAKINKINLQLQKKILFLAFKKNPKGILSRELNHISGALIFLRNGFRGPFFGNKTVGVKQTTQCHPLPKFKTDWDYTFKRVSMFFPAG